jgi:hypothetical protein
MAKVITFKAPAIHPKTREKMTVEHRGVIALLYVGNIQEKFVLQYRDGSDDVECLTHYASGYKFGDLNPIKLRHARSYKTLTDRAAAEELIADVLRVRSADDVRKIMNAMPVINGETR